MNARPNDKRRHDTVIVNLRAQLKHEQQLRHAAEQNASRFHALLIAERIRKTGRELEAEEDEAAEVARLDGLRRDWPVKRKDAA